MKNEILSNILNQITSIGSVSTDSEELKLKKSLLVLCAIPFMLTGVAWGIMYLSFGERSAALIPLSYSLFSFCSLLYFGYSHRFHIFRFSQLLLVLLLPFFLMLTLGGFVNGSAVILWSLLSPLGAMLFYQPSSAYKWLIAFGSLVVVSFIAEPRLRIETQLTNGQIQLFFLINIIAVGSLIFMMVYYFVMKKNFFQARSESLLLNILPKEIAEELKTNGKAEAKHFEEATVMFTDFKNFTQIAEKLSPTELVAEIDMIFRAFDDIISRHNLEKIKTIGDSYMCAGGLPVANKTHAVDTVSAAIEILRFIRNHIEKRVLEGKDPFEIRIGIHTGPVVAGIVGNIKFSYDIWGDTVNLASRMESSGEAGKINISGDTYELIRHRFGCTHRGKVKAKNKGEVDMYFVESY